MIPRTPTLRPQPLREPVPEGKDGHCGAGPQGSHRGPQPEEGCPLQGALVLGHGSGSHGDSRKKNPLCSGPREEKEPLLKVSASTS